MRNNEWKAGIRFLIHHSSFRFHTFNQGAILRPQDVIRKKRDGESLTREEIRFFADGVAQGALADYQASALLMAIFLRGMSADETASLTEAMLHSGEVLDFSDIEKPKVDKHSTG